MNITFFGFGLGWPEIVAVLALALLIFGARKLPELARGLGQGIKEFRKATREVSNDLHTAMEEEPPPPRQTPKTPAPSPDKDETVARSENQS